MAAVVIRPAPANGRRVRKMIWRPLKESAVPNRWGAIWTAGAVILGAIATAANALR